MGMPRNPSECGANPYPRGVRRGVGPHRPAAGVLEKLCCANTHVVCSDKYKEPTLVNYYDGADKIKGSDFLQQALDNLCKMSMAKTCSDCDQSKCTLFNASPAKRSCYGYVR